MLLMSPTSKAPNDLLSSYLRITCQEEYELVLFFISMQIIILRSEEHGYYVSRDKLLELIDLCEKDIAYLSTLPSIDSDEEEDYLTKEKFTYKIYQNVDEDLLNLPPEGGFFFGSTISKA